MPLSYRPAVTRSRPIGRFRLGNYVAEPLTDIEPSGGMSYDYLLEVREAVGEPVLVVSAEVSSMGTRCVGVFHDEGRASYPEDERFPHDASFATRALEIAAEWLKVSEPPRTEWENFGLNGAPGVPQADLEPLMGPREQEHGGV